MENFIRLFNLFSQTPTLKVNGKTRAPSNFGSCIGFFTISFLIAGISFILNDYFQGLTLKANSYIDNSVIPNIDLKTMKLGFLVSDYLGNELPDQERIFSIEAKFWTIQIPWKKVITPKVKFEKIEKIKCNQYKENDLHRKELEEYSKLYKNLECLDFDSLNRNLTGSYENFGKYILNI